MNLELDLELAKAENTLLRLHRAYERAKKDRPDLAEEHIIGITNVVPKFSTLAEKKINELRDEVLSMPAATKEERAAKLHEIKRLEAEKEKWDKIANDMLYGEEEPKKLEWWEEKPKRPDVTPLPKAEKVMVEKPKAPGFKIVKKNPLATASEIQLLVSIADKLDSKGLTEEATIIDNIIRLAVTGDPKVLQWQQNHNKKNNLKPGMPGFLTPDGIMGPATQQAMNKEKQMDFTKQVYNDPRKQPFDATKIPSRGSLISNRLVVTADKNSLIRALKSNDDNAMSEAMKALTNIMHNTPSNSTPAKELGLTESEFRDLAGALDPNRANPSFERAQEIMGISSDPYTNVVPNSMTHNPVTGLPYSGPMPKGFCPDCGKKLVMRYPGGDPENGPARLRCPQYHQGAEPCELCPHFFHQDKCKDCDCYSSWGTEEQQKEEEEMMKKLYGDDWDKNPDDLSQ